MDADMELRNSKTLEIALNLSEARNLELVIPRIKIDHARFPDKIFEYAYAFAAKTKIVGAFGAGMFILMKKSAFDWLGGFNEHLALGDDWDLTHRVKRKYFGFADVPVYTSKRRFKEQGYLPTFYEWLSVAVNKRYRNRGHEEYFQYNSGNQQ